MLRGANPWRAGREPVDLRARARRAFRRRQWEADATQALDHGARCETQWQAANHEFLVREL